jgi:hypothetical protein
MCLKSVVSCRDVCDHLSQEFAENGLVIIREGTPLKGLYFVRAGQVLAQGPRNEAGIPERHWSRKP